MGKKNRRILLGVFVFGFMGLLGFVSDERLLNGLVVAGLLLGYLLLEYFELIFVTIYTFFNSARNKLPLSFLMFVPLIHIFNLYIPFDRLTWIITILLLLPNFYFLGKRTHLKKYIFLLTFRIILFSSFAAVVENIYRFFFPATEEVKVVNLVDGHAYFHLTKAMVYYFIYKSLFRISRVTAVALGVWKKPRRTKKKIPFLTLPYKRKMPKDWFKNYNRNYCRNNYIYCFFLNFCYCPWHCYIYRCYSHCE